MLALTSLPALPLLAVDPATVLPDESVAYMETDSQATYKLVDHPVVKVLPLKDLEKIFLKMTNSTLEEQEAMARDLGADSLFYLPLESLAKCINLPAEKLCRACVTAEYPTEWGEKLYQLALRKHADPESNGRTYEHIPVTVCG